MWISRKQWNALNGRLNFLTRMCRQFDPLGIEEPEDSIRQFPRRLYDVTHMRVSVGTLDERTMSVRDVVEALLEANGSVAKWQRGTPAKVVLEPKP